MHSRHRSSSAKRHARSAAWFALERSGRIGRVSLDIRAAWAALAIMVALGLWGGGTTGYLLLGYGNPVQALQNERNAQATYDERMAVLRATIDRLTSRQLLDQNDLEGKVQALTARQVLLESRQAVVAALAGQAEGLTRSRGEPAGGMPRIATPANLVPLSNQAGMGGPAPDGVTAFAPVERKPRPVDDPLPLRGSAPSDPVGSADPQPPAGKEAPVRQRLSALDDAVRQLETRQIESLSQIEARTSAARGRYLTVFNELGIDRRRFGATDRERPQGGPLVPVSAAAAGPFETLAGRLGPMLAETDHLRRVVEALPLRRPLRGEMDTTSGFGYRIDPFTRGMALHTGIDFKDEYGAPVRATAPGRVITAEWNGGYGNLVEVDHGGGLTTRYAHMSAITVAEGQIVQAGAVLGRLGSTGRSTGPHLHYETRLDGEPVDPLRWLRTGARFWQG
jgi:murein DD-endopeptidase MepM/ murein hydrolase activator NlpD